MSSITSSKRAARLSRPPLLLSSHSIQNTQAAFPRSELADRYPSSIHWEPPLSSVGQGRVTSIFPLRKRSGFELQSLESPDTTLVHNPKHSSYQTTLKESRKAPKLDFSEYAMISSSRSYLTLKDELVQPLDGNDAAIKESYDATTIASDILIAANQHPTKWGLNYHLMVLCKNFAVVNFSSDLATFRWDIIDPKPPKPSTSTIATIFVCE
ncbi:hypothetical protein N7507_000519 [Penicillium longicatenatum]|nr:hypothetical protein N7507_000519 [Penicillium longicatenatum]